MNLHNECSGVTICLRGASVICTSSVVSSIEVDERLSALINNVFITETVGKWMV